MTPSINTHVELLTEQLSCLFRYVNDRRIHRSKYNQFKPLAIEDHATVTYKHEGQANGRSVVTIAVDTDNRLFEVRQHFNFGVMLNMEVYVSTTTDRLLDFTLSEFVNRYSSDEAAVKETLIDFEYAISVVTENIATQVVNVEI